VNFKSRRVKINVNKSISFKFIQLNRNASATDSKSEIATDCTNLDALIIFKGI
jgi:hypothetical protein